ncbi:hypothetical protein PHMEG_0002219 [Phytophthora megakarya]|uniref:Uncharacterized protein n=1 Tax=Phytophthora megakarya TaxID=4795 RepID=A0A225X169_9STRA|nr:hypothetical protein PHMEG_0002219 [Phytophthora megakarya]
MEDICSSSTKSTTFIASGLWSSEVTLRLAAKLLERLIYVMVARDGMEKITKVFEPYT